MFFIFCNCLRAYCDPVRLQLWQPVKLWFSLTELTVISEADGTGEFNCVVEVVLIVERIVSVGAEGQDLAAQIEITA